MKHFTSVEDVADIESLVAIAQAYKVTPTKDKTLGMGKRVGLLFMNPSMRTRLSTQVAAANLGLDTIVFNLNNEGWALELEDGVVMNGTKAEHIKDAAPILGAYFDIICVRTFPSLTNREKDYSEELLQCLIRYTGVPVVSMESATLHPLQSLADVLSISENWKGNRKAKVVLTWAPHVKPLPQCVSNSFAQWMCAWDKVDVVVTHPEGYELDEKYTDGAVIEHDQFKALEGADFVYAKNWSSYKEYGKILTAGEGWMPSAKHMACTNNARFMHCLPVRRNVEVADEVLDNPTSIVTQQASNRVWAAQAVLSEILKEMK